MIVPVNAPISDGGEFGATPYPLTIYNPDGSVFGARHAGIDFGCDVGTDVRAPESGAILFGGDAGSAGLMLQIKGKTGTHRLLHNSKLLRASGTVTGGEVVAKSGNTGFSSGPHVHWDLAINGKYVDPLKYIKEETMGAYINKFELAKDYRELLDREPTPNEIQVWVGKENGKEDLRRAMAGTLKKRWLSAEEKLKQGATTLEPGLYNVPK